MKPTETTVEVELVLAELGPRAERLVEMQADRHIDLRAASSSAAVRVHHSDLVPLNYLTGRGSAFDMFHSHWMLVGEEDRNETSLAVAEFDPLDGSLAGLQKAPCYGWETPVRIPD
jgi:hypothetical protein